MERTDFFPPEVKPVHVGWYETAWFDAGWLYDVKIWWDGEAWRDKPDGWALFDQYVTWRGQIENNG